MSNVTMDTAVLLLLVIALVPLTGVLLALTPYLMKKSEVFAVTVPEIAETDTYLKRLKRRYLIIVLALTLLATTLALVFFIVNDVMGVILSMLIGLLLVVVLSYALMLFYRKKVNEYKQAQGWQATREEAVAVITEMEVPEVVSLKWNLLHLPLFLITALIGILGYDSMPAQIPLQVDLSGEVSTWMDKSSFVIWMPVLVELFFAFCFVIAHWAIIRSKRPADPSSPLASAFAYGMFARAQSLYLVVGGLIMTTAIITMPLTFIGVISLMQAAVIIALAAFVLVIGAIVISVVYGQGGARVFRRMQESQVLLADDDHYWKLGIFYFNPDDPNWFLPARFGIGWTCNFARPVVWVFTLGIVGVTIAFVIIIVSIV